ncbi:MAG: acyl-CoA synthetase [Sphingopyxis macrogoltabida]|uniref:3-methylmercaptopropionyl-CoA ligase n=1 Tax=Sphingopyxis macrogoltabida TaxID=33050 RepID=A0A2W5MS56_SPHMC|nr:MAG: acyl-CoA synthetase [Sphingopyxis macrogoltabida]
MVDALVRRQSLSELLSRSAARHGERPAIICGEVEWSYARFDAIVDELAAGLVSANIVAGDRVAILARNSHSFMAVRFAVARIGAVLVPVNFMLNAAEVRYILDHSGARMLFLDRSTVDVGHEAKPDAIDAVFGLTDEWGEVPGELPSWESLLRPGYKRPPAADARSLAQIIYTSGTESRPKGAMLSHEAVLWQYQSCITDCEWRADTVAVHAMPLFHCAQLDAMIGPALSVGAKNVITSTPTPERLIPLFERYRATSFFAPPTVWISLLRSPLFDAHDLSTLVRGYYGASIMPVEVLREIRTRLPGLRLWNLYGQTEIAPVATILFPEEHEARLGSAGRATLHVETRIVDDMMRDVAVGEIGEIVHRSPQLLDGYWKDSEKTAEAFAGGWFHSGDLGTMDADGYITVVDRKKDMIKTGGENVSSREVEEILYTHPAVSEVAVIGLPDPRWIEAVTAYIVLRSGHAASSDELIEHCRAALAGFKVPKRVEFIDAMPRNASGKILKRDLRLVTGDA